MEYKINTSNIKSGVAFALQNGKNVAGIKLKNDNFRITSFPDSNKVKSLRNYNNYSFNATPIPFGYTNHEGMDFQAQKPTDIIADATIKVTKVGTTANGSKYLKYEIPASDGVGKYEVTLHHLSNNGKVGTYKKGAKIGTTGNSGVYNGVQTPYHLHIEMRGTSSKKLYDPLYEFDYKAPTKETEKEEDKNPKYIQATRDGKNYRFALGTKFDSKGCLVKDTYDLDDKSMPWLAKTTFTNIKTIY